MDTEKKARPHRGAYYWPNVNIAGYTCRFRFKQAYFRFVTIRSRGDFTISEVQNSIDGSRKIEMMKRPGNITLE